MSSSGCRNARCTHNVDRNGVSPYSLPVLIPLVLIENSSVRLIATTMMVGVGEVGAIIGIVDVATRVCLRLACFLQEVKDVGDTINSLRNKVMTFQDILSEVGAVMRKRSNNVDINLVSDDENRMLLLAAASLH